MTVVHLVLAVVVLFGTGAVLETMLPLAQDAAYHRFADTRCALGLRPLLVLARRISRGVLGSKTRADCPSHRPGREHTYVGLLKR